MAVQLVLEEVILRARRHGVLCDVTLALGREYDDGDRSGALPDPGERSETACIGECKVEEDDVDLTAHVEVAARAGERALPRHGDATDLREHLAKGARLGI